MLTEDISELVASIQLDLDMMQRLLDSDTDNRSRLLAIQALAGLIACNINVWNAGIRRSTTIKQE